MGKKFKKLRDFVSKNKKYLSLYLFLFGISNLVDGHLKSESEDYDDYTLFAIKKTDNDYPILSELLFFGNYFRLIRLILDIRNKPNNFVNHFVNGYLNIGFGENIYFIIQNFINPINKIYPLSYFELFLLFLLLLDSSSQFKDLLINTIFYDILQFIIVFLVIILLDNKYVRKKISYNGQLMHFIDVETGEIIKYPKDENGKNLIITFNRWIILKFLISVLSSGLIVGLRKIYEL